nr:HDIG domain-containing metalloprotein [uncultured Porphyromonas sp.]
MLKFLKDNKALYLHMLHVLAIFFVGALVASINTSPKEGYVPNYPSLKAEQPWGERPLVAPFEFPVLKTEEQMKMERDSVERIIPPTCRMDENVMPRMINQLHDQYKELAATVPESYYLFLQQQLKKYYAFGIIDSKTLDELHLDRRLEVRMLVSGQTGTGWTNVPVARLYRLSEVYKLIIDEATRQGLKPELLRQLEITQYLQPNVSYAEAETKRMLAEALSSLATSTERYQQGRRIIDQGEVLTPYTLNVIRSLNEEYKARVGEKTSFLQLPLLGYFFFLFTALAIYLVLFYREFTEATKNVVLVLLSILTFIGLTKLQVAHVDWFSIEVIPYVMIILLLRTFFASHMALTTYVITILAVAYFTLDPLNFIFVQLLAGFSAIFTLQSLSNRGQLIRAAFSVYLVYILSSMLVEWLTKDAITSDYWMKLLYYGVNLVFLMFTYVLAFLVERAFGYVSHVRLVELSDTAMPLLRELSEIAPGTFQHSYQVSILAQAAAARIGADTQLIRAGALYHDIGKMLHPEFFTENAPSNSPHRLLSAHESARVIIRHVTDGIILGQKSSLPPQIIDFIRTHHGRSTTRYFYNTYCNEHPGEEVDPEPFTYPGPNPQTKEQGILMLADSVEAASRSLTSYTEEGIRQLVQRLIDGIVAEGLLEDTPLTFRDIREIKEVFILKLMTMYHTRIAYPDKR